MWLCLPILFPQKKNRKKTRSTRAKKSEPTVADNTTETTPSTETVPEKKRRGRPKKQVVKIAETPAEEETVDIPSDYTPNKPHLVQYPLFDDDPYLNDEPDVMEYDENKKRDFEEETAADEQWITSDATQYPAPTPISLSNSHSWDHHARPCSNDYRDA